MTKDEILLLAWKALETGDSKHKDIAIKAIVKSFHKEVKAPSKKTLLKMAELYFDAGHQIEFNQHTWYYLFACQDYKNWVKNEWPEFHVRKTMVFYW